MLLLFTPDTQRPQRPKPTRILVVMPSWLGDCVMATPSIARLRAALPGVLLGALLRPGMDQVLAGLPLFDQVHVDRATGIMGPKMVAAKLRPVRYDATLLLTNSFSTALIVRIAGIAERVGYDRDARHLLLTRRLSAPTRRDGTWAPIPAVTYYHHAVECFLDPARPQALSTDAPLPSEPLEICVTEQDRAAATTLLDRAGASSRHTPLALLNPGGNKPEKRWPPDRYAILAAHLARTRGVRSLINGSPAEKDLCDAITHAAAAKIAREIPDRADELAPVCLPAFGVTISSLKAVVAQCKVMVTNDTGPRHLAAALGVPVVTLFGPTDHRWTTIPTRPGAPEAILVADPTLPPEELANDHPEQCRIDRISFEEVAAAVDRVWPIG